MIKKVINCLIHPSKILFYFASRNIIKMSDEKFLKLAYKLLMGKKLNLENPKKFSEKLQWLKLYNRKDCYTIMADKYFAKEWIANKIGENYIIPTIGVYNKFEDIDFSNLPNQFVMKCTHDSGGVLIVKDKNLLDLSNVKRKFKKSLSTNFFYFSREWVYKNIEPRIIIEEYMGDNLTDYRFYCFNGKVKLVYQYLNESQADGSKPEPVYCNIYNEKWERLYFYQAYKPSLEKYPKPFHFEKMISLAEKLTKDIPFLRVDFYIINEKIYFGEATFYPGGGFSKFNPEEYDYKIGKMLNLGDNNE